MPPTDLAPHLCPVCSKRFGKPAKLEQHLLEDHHFELRLSPGRDEPFAEALTTAVAEANAAFADAPSAASCPRCVPDTRPFRNARALAQHLLIKHLDCSAQMAGAVAKMEPFAEASSDVSCNPRKRKVENVEQGDAKRVRIDDTPKVAKSEIAPQVAGAGTRKDAVGIDAKKAPAARKEVTLATKQSNGVEAKAQASPKKAKTSAAKTKSVDASKAKRRSSAPGKTASPAASGSKPPVTPKKTKTKASSLKSSAQKGSPSAAPWLASPVVRIPAPAAITTAPMDFTSIGGFAANSRKSYYRLTGR